MANKVSLFGNYGAEIKELVQAAGFTITKNNPDFIISYGGDGTLMRAEYAFPGIPKIVLRGSRSCKKCSSLPNEEVLKRAKGGHYAIEELTKLEMSRGNKVFSGINDIVVHNKDPRHAIRYRLWVNAKPIGDEIIGDGIVVATPFGSTGYYRSITGSYFDLGIGIAFNNSTEPFDHMIIIEEGEVRVRIMRGPAIAYADNQQESCELSTDEEVFIRKAAEVAKIVKVEE